MSSAIERIREIVRSRWSEILDQLYDHLAKVFVGAALRKGDADYMVKAYTMLVEGLIDYENVMLGQENLAEALAEQGWLDHPEELEVKAWFEGRDAIVRIKAPNDVSVLYVIRPKSESQLPRVEWLKFKEALEETKTKLKSEAFDRLVEEITTLKRMLTEKNAKISELEAKIDELTCEEEDP